MKGSGGYRRRTRNIKVPLREKGKVKIRRYLQNFEMDDMVSISIDPSYSSIPHPRFRGKCGKIVGKQGRSYYVRIKEGKKIKHILTSPEHLVKIY